MAHFEMQYASRALGMEVSVKVILPEFLKTGGASYKTLYLLHGLSGDHTSWTRYTAIERYAREQDIAVVMPAVGRSWYADTAYGAKYFTFVAEELPAACRGFFKGISDRREDTFVGGLSMGGYGALKLAMTYPERYGGCIALSGSLDVTRRGRPYSLEEWRGNFGYEIESAEALEGGDNDLFALAARNAAEGREFPALYLWCGTEDTLLAVNRRYSAHLTALGVPHVYTESEGDHSWRWWDHHIDLALRHFFAPKAE
jgi:S-formylglutathione hydrolase FrmB